jgi:hypothetical protein
MKMLDYRIKGLEGLTEPKFKAETPTVSATKDRPETAAPETFGLIGRALGFPRLTDVLYHFEVDQVADRWPTFTYFHPPVQFGPVKSEPLRLVQSMYPLSPDAGDGSMYSILIRVRQQRREQVAIRTLLAGEAEDFSFSDVPVAASLEAYLRRGSAWLRNRREKIFKTILRSPEASFIALSSGAWNDRSPLLLEAIAASPDLVLQVWRSPIRRRQLTEDWVMRALHDHPAHRAVAISLQPRRRAEAREVLHLGAATNAQAAAICFALDPFNPKAEEWWTRAHTDGRALYWIGRVWKLQGRKTIDLPHREEIVRRLGEDNENWLYHWARDIQPEEAKKFAAQLWPSPWAVELIEDLKLPHDFVADLLNSTDFEKTRAQHSSLIFWATEYASK